MSDGDLTPDQLPVPPRRESDGSIRDVYAEFSGFGPAGPGYHLLTVAELVDDGGSHYWPRLVWDAQAWGPPDDEWFDQHFPMTDSRRRAWGPGRWSSPGA